MFGTIQQAYEEMKSGVYIHTVNGECSSCGQCCSNLLPVSSREIKEIRRYMKKNHIEECRHIYPLAVPPDFDLTCPFRSDDEKKCTIYPVRPEICRCFKCDRLEVDIKRDRNLMHKRYNLCDMRETFFGGE